MRLAALATMIMCSAAASAEDNAALEKRGQALLAKHCAPCHAIGRTGNSTHPEAPPFRTLSSRYPIESLEEALGEGLMTGHPDMPEFQFGVEEVGAVIAYLNAIQDR